MNSVAYHTGYTTGIKLLFFADDPLRDGNLGTRISGPEVEACDFTGKVVFFTCNHCLYVIGSDEITRRTVEKFKGKGVAFIGINSNSERTYAEDGFAGMVERMKKNNFPTGAILAVSLSGSFFLSLSFLWP